MRSSNMAQAGDHQPPTTPEDREALDTIARLLEMRRDGVETAEPGTPGVSNRADLPVLATEVLLEALPVGVALVRDGTLAFANTTFARTLGFRSGAELIRAGGLRAVLSGAAPPPVPGDAAGQAIPARTRDGLPLSLRRIETGQGPLDILTIGEPETPPVAPDRTAEEQPDAQSLDFLAKVSHEVRTPLNSIIGFAELMLEEQLGVIENPKYRSYIEDIHQSGLYALSLVNDLLDISKVEAGQFGLDLVPVDVEEVVHEAVDMMQPQARQRRTVLRTAITPGLPCVLADARRLKQILLNLLTNAVKFTEPGGQVVISLGAERGGICVRVRDSGVGMSANGVTLAMQPFRQLDTLSSRQGGTGLGLPLTKALAEASGAAFSITSEPNVGTVVDIFFAPERTLRTQSSG